MGQVSSLELTQPRCLTVTLLPEEQMVYQPRGPFVGAVHLVTPSTTAQRLVGHPAKKRIDKLVDRDQNLEAIGMLHALAFAV